MEPRRLWSRVSVTAANAIRRATCWRDGGGQSLEGAVIGGFEAPSITAAALADRGWNREDLVLFFETGRARKGLRSERCFWRSRTRCAC